MKVDKHMLFPPVIQDMHCAVLAAGVGTATK